MSTLLNRLSGKISRYHLLMGPPDAASNAAGGNGKPNAGGNNDAGNQNNGGGDDDGTGDDDSGDNASGDDDDSEPGFDDIFKKRKGAADDDFSELDEDDSDDALTEEQQNAGKAVGKKIRDQIAAFALKEEDLNDVDFNDKAAVAKFMTTHSQKQIHATMSMLPDIINHALGITLSKIDGKIQKAVKNTTTKNEAHKEFGSLGYTGADREFAMTIYRRGLSNKMTPAQAAKATQNAMSQLGKPPKGNGGRRDRSGDSSMKEGTSALDAMFGS